MLFEITIQFNICTKVQIYLFLIEMTINWFFSQELPWTEWRKCWWNIQAVCPSMLASRVQSVKGERHLRLLMEACMLFTVWKRVFLFFWELCLFTFELLLEWLRTSLSGGIIQLPTCKNMTTLRPLTPGLPLEWGLYIPYIQKIDHISKTSGRHGRPISVNKTTWICLLCI